MCDPVAAAVSGSRGWPVPRRPWLLRMVWEDLLFAHWPCEPAALEAHLPPGLTLDTCDGRAWLGVVPFRISGIRARCLPTIPGLTGFPELNLRTYVVADDKPGVWFFSLDATSRAAVRCARRFYHLPYRDARITCSATRDGWIDYRCRRYDRQHPAAEFSARYRPLGVGAPAALQPAVGGDHLVARPRPSRLTVAFVGSRCQHDDAAPKRWASYLSRNRFRATSFSSCHRGVELKGGNDSSLCSAGAAIDGQPN